MAEHFPGGSGSPAYVLVPEDRAADAVTVLERTAGIDSVAFDRAGYRYHGRVKALAEAAREAGLKF